MDYDDFLVLDDSVTSRYVRFCCWPSVAEEEVAAGISGAVTTLEATVVADVVFFLLVLAVVVIDWFGCESIVILFLLVRKSILVKSGKIFPEIS